MGCCFFRSKKVDKNSNFRESIPLNNKTALNPLRENLLTAEERNISEQKLHTLEKAPIVEKKEALSVSPQIVEKPLQPVQPQIIVVQISEEGAYSLLKMPPIEQLIDEGKAWVRKVINYCMFFALIFINESVLTYYARMYGKEGTYDPHLED